MPRNGQTKPPPRMKITDLLTLNDFMAALLTAHPAIDVFLPLSNGETAVDEISAYYTNDYGGCTAFFQTAEVIRKADLMTFQCSLTIALKPADQSTRAGLAARNATLRIMLELMGSLTLQADQAAQTIEDNDDMYDLIVAPVDRIYPIGLLANVNLQGHYVDLDVTVPATHLLFPA